MPLVLFIPTKAENKVPVILLANRDDVRRMRLALNSPQSYGKTANGIPLHQLMMRGIGVATIDYKAFGTDNRNSDGKVSGGIALLIVIDTYWTS